jgi:rhamnopyranosyl-N-acetylglucosaminyl-diphospho-decaprenol beta-1,3/1,4-galactofuranosyltransferase
MENEIKIASIVVTFNRKDMILKCLNAILNETKKVDHIFIVDNNSTDGTEELMKNSFSKNNLITYIRLNENIGSSGGFNKAVEYAYEWGADWIWFLDDDVMPRPDCLEVMLKYQNISKCIHPNKVDIYNNEFIWESVFDPAMGRATFLNNISFKNGKDFTFLNMGCFEGMLIHREIVEKIGYPDKRFFICSDDTIYGFVASLFTNVILVRDAVLDKQIAFSHVATPTFFYYYIRNQFLVKEYLKKYKFYNKYLFNLNFIIFVCSACTKHMIRNKKLLTPIYVFKGVLDGIRGKFYKLNWTL